MNLHNALTAFFATVIVFGGYATCAADPWVHQGFAEFAKGTFDDGGSNLYVNADGVMELIHRWGVNNDGYVDLFLANSHDYLERGPTRVYKVEKSKAKDWKYRELPNTKRMLRENRRTLTETATTT